MDGSFTTRHDPFIQKFLSRVPQHVADSYTPEQLEGIKLAFGARQWGHHRVDFRQSFRLLFWRCYVVFLFGAETRSEERLAAEGRAFGTVGNALISLFFIALVTLPVLYVLYEIKNALGIDLSFDGGGHDIFKSFLDSVAAFF